MNIFTIDDNPVQAAKWLVDKHISKMLLESCQIFCTNYHLQGTEAPYKPSHKNHPSTAWSRTSYDNFLWLLEHSYAIAAEYTERYGRRHKSEDVLDWIESNMWRLSFDSNDLTPFAIAISEDSICRTLKNFDQLSVVEKYRLYYKYDKQHIHQWKQNKPEWI
jgi:Pyrimidine dimer DNA glycosylase